MASTLADNPGPDLDEQLLLEAHRIKVSDHRRTLLPTTSVAVRTGEIVVVEGDPGYAHTALALALAGRLKVDDGRVSLDGEQDRRPLQRAVALVDVPGVNDPDENVRLTTIVGEELAIAGRRAGSRQVRAWLTERGHHDLVSARIEDLSPAERVAILADLAAARPEVEFLVLALPDRHGVLPDAWVDHARRFTDQGLGVLATTSPGVVPRGLATDLRFTAFDDSEVPA